mmetsp:Transcript_114593/g.286419  ORF Transcript_114593/g.286419 Transcript_114593/m.286419 type:complete len:272 (+) Transcript_114593:1060-1875(+)
MSRRCCCLSPPDRHSPRFRWRGLSKAKGCMQNQKNLMRCVHSFQHRATKGHQRSVVCLRCRAWKLVACIPLPALGGLVAEIRHSTDGTLKVVLLQAALDIAQADQYFQVHSGLVTEDLVAVLPLRQVAARLKRAARPSSCRHVFGLSASGLRMAAQVARMTHMMTCQSTLGRLRHDPCDPSICPRSRLLWSREHAHLTYRARGFNRRGRTRIHSQQCVLGYGQRPLGIHLQMSSIGCWMRSTQLTHSPPPGNLDEGWAVARTHHFVRRAAG